MTLLYLESDLQNILAFQETLVANDLPALITTDQLATTVLSQHLLMYLYPRNEVAQLTVLYKGATIRRLFYIFNDMPVYIFYCNKTQTCRHADMALVLILFFAH